MEDSDSLVKASALAKFAAQLRAWRQRSGWSQAELADKLLCSNSLVSGVETMGKTPTLDFAKRVDPAFDLPSTFVVLHEGTLRHLVGGSAVMAGQLEKIIDIARLPDAVIQVLPFAASDHPGADGPISVFDFADAASVAYTECKGGGMIVESAGQVAELMTTVNLIRAVALPPRESMNLIMQIRSEIGDERTDMA